MCRRHIPFLMRRHLTLSYTESKHWFYNRGSVRAEEISMERPEEARESGAEPDEDWDAGTALDLLADSEGEEAERPESDPPAIRISQTALRGCQRLEPAPRLGL